MRGMLAPRCGGDGTAWGGSLWGQTLLRGAESRASAWLQRRLWWPGFRPGSFLAANSLLRRVAGVTVPRLASGRVFSNTDREEAAVRGEGPQPNPSLPAALGARLPGLCQPGPSPGRSTTPPPTPAAWRGRRPLLPWEQGLVPSVGPSSSRTSPLGTQGDPPCPSPVSELGPESHPPISSVAFPSLHPAPGPSLCVLLASLLSSCVALSKWLELSVPQVHPLGECGTP